MFTFLCQLWGEHPRTQHSLDVKGCYIEFLKDVTEVTVFFYVVWMDWMNDFSVIFLSVL